MKKRSLALAALLALAFLVASQPDATAQAPVAEDASGNMDVVVLLDSSQSVLPYYQDVTDFLLSSVVRDYLRFGDTFHLLSFGDSAQTEIAQKMSDERDVKSVLGRLYLLYPLAQRTDFLGALDYLRQYLDDLSESRRKVVVVVTDGMHNPPAGSASAALEPGLVASGIESICGDIRSKGWELRLVRLPFAAAGSAGSPASGTGTPGAAESPRAASGPGSAASTAAGAAADSVPRQTEPGGDSYFDIAAKALGAPVAEFDADEKESLARKSLSLPVVQYPGRLGKRGYFFSFPLKVHNGSGSEIGLELDSLLLDGREALDERAFLRLEASKSGTLDIHVAIPAAMEPGEKSLGVEPRFANGLRVDPPVGLLQFTLRRSPLASLFRSSARIALFAVFVILGLAIALAIVLIIRRVSKRAQAPVVAAVLDSEASLASTRTRASAGKATPAAAGPALGLAGRDEHEAAIERETAARAEAARAEAARTAAILRPTERDEHDAVIEREAAAMAEASRAEAGRSASVLSDAAASRSFAEAKERIEYFKSKRKAARRAAPAGEGEARAASSDHGMRVVKPGTMRVELRVEDQNPNVGTRNIHTMHAGASKSVGGGRSDFLVFLVPAARHAAEIRFDGEALVFVPRKPELFPGTDGPLEDCIDQEILMLGRNGYPLVLRFVRYECPVEKINRLLHCIETPGLFEGLDVGS